MFKKLKLKLLLTIIVIITVMCAPVFSETILECEKENIIQPKRFDYLLGTLDGISDNQLKQHFKLYNGYIQKINKINSKLKTAKKDSANTTYSKYRALQAARAFANNGVVLHEMYFSNLSSKETKPSETLLKQIQLNFKNNDNYINDLKALCKASRGWVVSGYNHRDNKLHNYLIDEHDIHVPVDVSLILVIDVWEHAYMVDYGIDRAAYTDAVIKNIDWKVVSGRLEKVKLK